MTKNEIMTELRCCATFACNRCPAKRTKRCVTQLLSAAADLIEKMSAELADAKQQLTEETCRVDDYEKALGKQFKSLTALKNKYVAVRNELCQYCGKYKKAHEGACDGCRWREM